MSTCPLYDYQKAPSQQLVRALTHGREEWGYPGAVDLSDVGVGKSFMDFSAMLQVRPNIVVLCPKVGEVGWQKTASIFNHPIHYLGSYEGVKGGWRDSVATRHADGAFTWHNAGQVGLILDECQAVKGMDSLASACIDGAIQAGIPIICASATLASSPLEMRIAGRVTGLHTGDSDWKRFMVENGCRYVEQEERWVWNRKAHLLEQLHHRLIPQRGCRVRKSDLGERPGGSVDMLPIECEEGPQIQQEWAEANRQIEEMRKKRYPHMMLVNIRRKIRMRLWKLSEQVLAPHVAKLMQADLEEGKSVLAFVGFTETRERLGKLLGTRDGFYGGQNDRHRAMLIRDFQANRIRVLINQIKAGGSSVSLDDVTGDYPRVTYLFPSDSGQLMEQVPGRTDRTTSKSHAQVWIPCIRGGLTEQMVKSTSRKLFAMAALNDGGKS